MMAVVWSRFHYTAMAIPRETDPADSHTLPAPIFRPPAGFEDHVTFRRVPAGKGTRLRTAMPYDQLQSDKIIETVQLLHRRIGERFPNGGLTSVCEKLVDIARKAQRRSEEIGRPIVWVRVLSAAVIMAVLVSFAWTISQARLPDRALRVDEIVTVLDAALNDVVLIGATIFFFVTLETRIKRRRALQAIHELRSMAHIVDMHQLTKDPERVLRQGPDTRSSPKRTMTRFELSRYLDYCSEMMSLIGKVAALYVQSFSDEVAVAAVNDIENLTNGMARRIWQKLMVLESAQEANGQ